MLLKEISEFHKTAVFYEDNQGSVLLVNNMQVGRRPKNIDIHHQCLSVCRSGHRDAKLIHYRVV